MRYMKMLGLAVVAALALTALAGVGSASATTLCKKTVSPCPAGETYALGTVIEGHTSSVTLETTEGLFNPVITCATSTFSGKTTSVTASPTSLTGSIERLTFTGCIDSVAAGFCSTVVANLPLTAHITTAGASSSGNGTLTLTGFEITFLCHAMGTSSFGVDHCRYKGEVVMGLTGGTPASALANNQTLTKSGGDFGCPNKADWTAKYTITKPSPLFVI